MLKLLSVLYQWLVARRNAQFDRHERPIVPVDRPVISVGNISAGGTGKTPVVQMLVGMLRQAGLRPAVVLRGYRRRSRGLVVVHDGQQLRVDVAAAGDEAFLHAKTLGVPVVVSSDKVEAAAHAAGNLPCDVIVVDDGFQHRALHRDVDVVIIDPATLSGSLLPAGRLREPLAALGRADIVLVADGVTPEQVRPLMKSSARAFALHRSVRCAAPTNVPVLAVSGIARAERFHDSLRSLGYTIAGQLAFADHHRYTAFNVRTIAMTARKHHAQIITTSKDHVKLAPLIDDPALLAQIFVLELEAHVDTSAPFLSELLRRINP